MNSRVKVRLESEALTDAVEIAELRGREAISDLFDFDVLIVCPDAAGLDVEALLKSKVTLVFETTDHQHEDLTGALWRETRRVHTIVSECEDMMLSEDYATYRLRLVPRMWLSTMVETLDIFMEMSVPDIVKAKLDRIGVAHDFRITLDHYPAREFVVQYKENDLAFMSRWLEHYGISFFFERRDDKSVVVFTDGNTGFTEIDRALPFVPSKERAGIHDLRSVVRRLPQRYVQRDYNYRNPQADLTGMADLDKANGGGIVEYGGHFKSDDEAKWFAHIRMQEAGAQRRVYRGSSSDAHVGAGARFTVQGHPRHDQIVVVVTEVEHHARQPTLLHDDSDPHGYENSFRAIPMAVTYRPPRVTPKPRVQGVLTGIIDGPSEATIAEVDDEGRYRVKFMFDTNETDEGKASRVIRMMQPHAGAGYGMHFPLRPGVEVLITFIDGDPDRPIIAGTVPNPQTASPVDAGNAARNVIRTGGGNEINIDDTEGSTRIKMSVPHSKTIFQLGAPNESEVGALLQTEGAYTTVAKEGHTSLGAIETGITLLKNGVSSDISSVAKNETKFAHFLAMGQAWAPVVIDTIKGGIAAARGVLSVLEKTPMVDAARAGDQARNAKKTCDDCNAELDDAFQAVCQGLDPTERAALKTVHDGRKDALAARERAYETMIEKRRLRDMFFENTIGYYTDASAEAMDNKYDKSKSAYAAAKSAWEAAPVSNSALNDAIAQLAGDPADLAAHIEALPANDPLRVYDAKLNDCTSKCVADLDAARLNADAAVTKYQDIRTAHSDWYVALAWCETQANALSEAATIFFSQLTFLYTTFSKVAKAVDAEARWTAANSALIGLGADVTLANKVTPSEPNNTLGSEGSTMVYGEKELMAWSPELTIMAMGTTMDTPPIADTNAGKLNLIGCRMARVASPKKVVLESAEKVGIYAYDNSDNEIPAVEAISQGTMTLSTEDPDDMGEIKIKTCDDQWVFLDQDNKKLEIKTMGHLSLSAGDDVVAGTESWGLKADENAGITLGDDNNKLEINNDQVKLQAGNDRSLKLSSDEAVLAATGGDVLLNAQGGYVILVGDTIELG